MDYVHVNLFVFLYYLLATWSIDGAIARLSRRYRTTTTTTTTTTTNFLVSLCGCFRIWLLQTPDGVRHALSSGVDGKLTFVSKNFIRAHGHRYGIGNLDFDLGDHHNLWRTLHDTLKQSLEFPTLERIMEKHADIVTHKYGFKYNVNDVIAEYVATIWAEYCFGEGVDVGLYRQLHRHLVTTLRATFHGNWFNYVPFVGAVVCTIKRVLHRKAFRQVDQLLGTLLTRQEGFLARFAQRTRQELARAYPAETIDRVIIDNAFLSVLVYDFLHILMLDVMMSLPASDAGGDTGRDTDTLKSSLRSSFMFPYRMRYINRSQGELRRGDFVVVNLVKSENFFSSGPRTCVGMGLVYKFHEIFRRTLRPFRITRSPGQGQVVRGPNRNIPLIISRHDVTLRLPETTLSEVLDHFEHKQVKKFYRIEAITENLPLYKYICHRMAEWIVESGNVECLVVSEARGFLLSPVALLTNLPLVTVRKGGKLAGPVVSQSYQKAYGPVETVELSRHSAITGKNVVILDDGIATGETTKAVHQLLRDVGANVLFVGVCVRHGYVKSTYTETEVRHVFTL